MIQLKRFGSVLDFGDVEQLRLEFREKHCVLLPMLLEPSLLDFLLQRLSQAQWRDMKHEGIGTEVVSDDPPALSLLHFLANRPAFLDAVGQISGCGGVTWFGGRVYRFIPNSGHHDSWHDDNMEGRQVGMSINLSERGYDGGVFELRERQSKRILIRVANTGLGDATLFRISRDLKHQVTEVTGEMPKTAFAGWFQSGKQDLLSRLRGIPNGV
jgi:hypothetical protein